MGMGRVGLFLEHLRPKTPQETNDDCVFSSCACVQPRHHHGDARHHPEHAHVHNQSLRDDYGHLY